MKRVQKIEYQPFSMTGGSSDDLVCSCGVQEETNANLTVYITSIKDTLKHDDYPKPSVALQGTSERDMGMFQKLIRNRVTAMSQSVPDHFLTEAKTTKATHYTSLVLVPAVRSRALEVSNTSVSQKRENIFQQINLQKQKSFKLPKPHESYWLNNKPENEMAENRITWRKQVQQNNEMRALSLGLDFSALSDFGLPL